MKTFKKFTDKSQSIEDINSLVELVLFLEMNVNELHKLDEAKVDISKALKKIGMERHQERGLIHILKDSGVHIGKIFHAAFKSHIGTPASKKEAKEQLKSLLSKKITKEEIIDVLLKLDMITLHAITGPIHVIDAITGWHLWADVHSKVQKIGDRVHNAVKILSDVNKEVTGKLHKRVDGIIKKIQSIFATATV